MHSLYELPKVVGLTKHTRVRAAWDPTKFTWFNLQGLNWERAGGTDSEVIMCLLFLCVSRWGGTEDYRRRAAAAAAAPHGKQPAPDSFNVQVHLNFMLRRKWKDGPLNEMHQPFLSVITLPTFEKSRKSMKRYLIDTSRALIDQSRAIKVSSVHSSTSSSQLAGFIYQLRNQ